MPHCVFVCVFVCVCVCVRVCVCRYKERKYPENTERLVIQNTNDLEAEVHFCFQHDTKATTFILDPPVMMLQPNQAQVRRRFAPLSETNKLSQNGHHKGPLIEKYESCVQYG